jgi:hypothetical protein
MVKTPEGMSFRDYVRTIIPDADDRECDFVLWEFTPFPMIKTPENLKPYIETYVKVHREQFLSAYTEAKENVKKGKG